MTRLAHNANLFADRVRVYGPVPPEGSLIRFKASPESAIRGGTAVRVFLAVGDTIVTGSLAALVPTVAAGDYIVVDLDATVMEQHYRAEERRLRNQLAPLYGRMRERLKCLGLDYIEAARPAEKAAPCPVCGSLCES